MYLTDPGLHLPPFPFVPELDELLEWDTFTVEETLLVLEALAVGLNVGSLGENTISGEQYLLSKAVHDNPVPACVPLLVRMAGQVPNDARSVVVNMLFIVGAENSDVEAVRLGLDLLERYLIDGTYVSTWRHLTFLPTEPPFAEVVAAWLGRLSESSPSRRSVLGREIRRVRSMSPLAWWGLGPP